MAVDSKQASMLTLEEKGGEAIWFLGNLAEIKVTGAETDGRFSIVEFLGHPESVPPLHVHHREDEAFYVLEGEMTFRVGDGKFKATAGSFAFGPKEVPHTFSNDSPTVRMLVVASPAGFEDFVREAGEPAKELSLPPPSEGPPDFERIATIGAKYGIEFLERPPV